MKCDNSSYLATDFAIAYSYDGQVYVHNTDGTSSIKDWNDIGGTQKGWFGGRNPPFPDGIFSQGMVTVTITFIGTPPAPKCVYVLFAVTAEAGNLMGKASFLGGSVSDGFGDPLVDESQFGNIPMVFYERGNHVLQLPLSSGVAVLEINQGAVGAEPPGDRLHAYCEVIATIHVP